VPLAGFTTFGIGGPAGWLAEPATRGELREALALAGELGVEARVIGGGSNLLIADSGFPGLVVRLSPRGEFGSRERLPGPSRRWRVGAAAALSGLVDHLAGLGVAGLEFLAGVPGSVGGAARMNAGGGGRGFGRFVVEAEVFPFAGGELVLSGDDLSFSYRQSRLAGGVAVALILRFLESASPEAVLAGMRESRARKRESQPLDLPSAGCVFRNPPGESAGALLEEAGCKGWREGGAEVSDRHANFIVNRGGASAREVALLAGRMRRAVAKARGVWLELEVILWGDDPVFPELTERNP
jgi:UDP-N-acetylmuramate dehydrogenase